MKQDVMVIENVRCYLDAKGTAWLNAEDVARGLGFVMIRRERVTTSGDSYEAVRWDRVNGYLQEFDPCMIVGKDDFIPENMFYLLAMKANNDTAKIFQWKVANEILPSIRKHGVYATEDFIAKSIANPDWAIAILQQLKVKQEENNLLKLQNAELQPKANYYDVILQCPDLVTTSQIAKDYGYSAKHFNKILHKLGIQFKQSGTWLLYQGYAAQGWSSTKTHKYMGGDGVIHCKVHMYWTQKGRIGLYDFLKGKGYLPTVERG